ncbi:GerAB/ArcD/ProY family transporter [Brevibacillus fulvus]|uniref:Spore germination protein n=1 Tax=Brevibacillus fulvus TaxID=1125967 RepID=A0A938XXQ9_9BACL|nr:endospore germination permease [Brevibacillus fulvus]MBM7590094.1 spore germination protein [Brevibacillus fulvus]
MERISGRQIILIGSIWVMDSTLISLPAQMVRFAKQDAWLSLIMVAAIIALVLWCLSKVHKRFPNQDLYDALITRWPRAGKAVVFIYVLFFAVILIRDIRTITDFINVSLLQLTPLWIITALLLYFINKLVSGGIEVIARMIEFFIPSFYFILLLVPALSYKEFDLSRLGPVFEFEWYGMATAGWYSFSYIGEIIGISFMYSNATLQFRHGLASLLIGVLLLSGVLWTLLLILGTDLMPHLTYPVYELVRQVKVTDFLDRFEIPMVAIYFPTMFVKIGFSLYLVCHGMNRLMPRVPIDSVVPAVGILVYVCSFWFFRDAVQLIDFNREWTALAIWPELILPIFLSLFLRPKQKQTRPEQQQEIKPDT